MRHAHRPNPPYTRRELAHDVVVAFLVLVIFIAWTAAAVGVTP
jgi:hypothetical protein